MPDLDCAGTRLYEHLREGRFVLATRDTFALDDRPAVRVVHCSALNGPAMVLVRPDGYVAWASNQVLTAPQASAVLAEWCGEPVKQERLS